MAISRTWMVRSAFVSTTLFLLTLALPPARAFALSGDEANPEATALTQMEDRARHAEAREQVYLFTEVIKAYSDVASREIAAGDMEHANAHLKHIEQFTTLIHGVLMGNAKRLKEAQMVLHAAVYRLGETLRYVSAEDKAAVQATLRQLDKLNDELLTQVFAH